MSRLWWRLLAALLLLPLLLVVLMSFTQLGSRLVVGNIGRLLPLEIEYGGGTLVGELELNRLAWASDTLAIEIQGLMFELKPGCLWHSELCFQQLNGRQLTITLLPGDESDGEGKTSEVAPDGPLFEFPVPIQASALNLEALTVRWAGGQWQQGNLEGAVKISGSTIAVERALIDAGRLELTGSDEPVGAFSPPRINLPLTLLVKELVLAGASWDLGGVPGKLDVLKLTDGNWQQTGLQLGGLKLRSPVYGEWLAVGSLDFSGQWPLSLRVEGTVPEISGWPAMLGTALTLRAKGTLAALELEADSQAQLAFTASASLDAVAPGLPFNLSVKAEWPETLALSSLVHVPQSLDSIVFSAPLTLSANGSVDQQFFQLEGSLGGLEYPLLDLRLAGSHSNKQVLIEDLRLQDKVGSNTLWATGQLEYGEALAWSAVLESSGLDLLPLRSYADSRVEGRLQLQGRAEGEQWQLSLTEADISGSVDGVPAHLQGYAGINSQLELMASNLEAQGNGSTLVLQVPETGDALARFSLSVEDMQKWQPDIRGRVSLRAEVMPGWRDVTITGSVAGVQWQGLKVASGEIDGYYHPQRAQSLKLDLKLKDSSVAGFQLSDIELSGQGDSSRQAFALRGRGDVEGLLELTGNVDDNGHWTGELASTTLQMAQGNWYLGDSIAMEFHPSPARLHVEAHCWQYRQTSICPGDAQLGEEGSASLDLDGDLELLTAFLPEYLELQGLLSGQFSASWKPGAPVAVTGEAQGRDITFTRHFAGEESGSARWDKVDVRINNDALGLAIDTDIYSEGNRVFVLQLGLPPQRSEPMSGTLNITGLQLQTLAPFAPTLAVLEGEVSGNLSLAGSVEQPTASGVIQLSDGQFALLGNPTRLEQLSLELEARGDRAVLAGKGLLGGGTLTLEGELSSVPEWQLELAIEGDQQEILLPPYTQMLVSEQLNVKLTRGLFDLSGDITVHEGTLEHEQLPEGAVSLSGDVVEVDLEGNVVYEAAPFDVSMRIGLLIRDKFKIVGDTVSATLGGNLRLRQEPRQPLQLFGNLNVISGELRAYQQHLRIKRGTVSFSGSPENPELDVRAQREISTDNVVVGLHLQGSLKQPRLDVFSDPVMSHGETMSYLLRGRGLDAGASSDGVAMALSMGTGLVNQTALVEELNRIPGISNFAFGAEGTDETDTAATVGGYIGERLYLSYGMGIYEPINVLTARLYLKSRLWLEVVSRLENSVDLYYSFDIK